MDAEDLVEFGGRLLDSGEVAVVKRQPRLCDEIKDTGPIAVYASGRLEGEGCKGTMIFDGIARSGASCESPPIFEGPVYGVPGVTRLFGSGWGPQVQEFLYDRQGNIVGADQPNVKVEGNSAPNSNSLDCNTPQGFRRAPFSSTVELY